MTTILVVDDSQFVRTVANNALTKAGYTVETATNGVEAVDLAIQLDPDVITMDVEMPEMDGIEATERIMSKNPTPILMVSAHTDAGTTATLDALERGAIDWVYKDGDDPDLAARLASAVESALSADISSLALARATAAVYATTTGRESATGANRPSQPQANKAVREASGSPLIIIGASTGGPKIVERVLMTLPPELEARVIVVQHMPKSFTGRFATRLDAQCAYTVREAADGERLRPGEVAIAPGDSHLEVGLTDAREVTLLVTDGEPRHGVRPAVDVSMESAAAAIADTYPLIGVILSGMGRDGAAGIEAIANAGGKTVAQDEQTSPVFGMPNRAIETGRVDEVASADRLVDAITDAVLMEDETNG